MTIVVVGPVSRHATARFVDACERNDWPVVLLGTPNSALAEHRHRVLECLTVPSLDLPLAELVDLLAPWNPTGVVPAGELAVPVSDRLAARFGVPHNPLDVVEVYRNKDMMRAAFRAVGLAQPRVHGVFATLAEVEEADWSSVQFPVIVKPVDGAGSYFVRRCDSRAELFAALPPIFQRASSEATGVSFRRQAVVEDFIDGSEFSAQCVVADGVAEEIFPLRKFLSPFPHCDETAHLCADVLDDTALAALRVTVAKVVEAYQVRNTVLHVDFKSAPDGAQHVIEVGNRVAGDQISELVELRHGWMLEEALVRLRSGLDVHRARRGNGVHAAYGVRFQFGAGAEVPAPSQVRTVRQEATDSYPPVEGQGEFHLSQRTGYTLQASDDVTALIDYLAGTTR